MVELVRAGAVRRVYTPTVLQMEAVECGAAALGIILGYYGCFVSLEELRHACGVSRDGSKAANVLRAARSFGLEAKGLRYESASLSGSHCPLVAFWNFNHFLVVEGFGKDKVYLNDPAIGRRVVTYQEFDTSFTGVVLAMRPGPEFVRKGHAPSTIASLARRLPGIGIPLTFVMLASIALIALQLVIPAFTRIFIDSYVTGHNAAQLPAMFALMFFAVLLIAGTVWLQQRALLRLETYLALRGSSTFLQHVMRLPIRFFTQRSPGEISTRVVINDRVARLLSGELATNSIGLLLIVLYLALMLRYDALLTGVATVLAVLNLAALRYVSRRRRDENQRQLAQSAQLFGTAIAGLQAIETLKAAGGEADFFARWAGEQARLTNAKQSLGIPTVWLGAVPPFLSAIGVAAIFVLGGLRVINGALSVGTLVAFQVLVASFLAPVTGLVSLGAELQETEGYLRRIDDVLQHPVDDEAFRGLDGAADIGRLSGQLELREVTFGYSELEPPLIEAFSLTVEPGARVALVGSSGSGKSTIARLITGLTEPWSGEVLVDGRRRRDIPRPVLARSLTAANQEITLYEGTVRDNLTMWDHTISAEAMIQAARDACIHSDITGRPGGYRSRIDEDGRNFSGGQRQRLEIARALVGDPSIVVLDEATSALDAVTEKLVDDNLRRRGVTCLIIAHRLSTIRDCDEIVVLEQGKVVERGTHEWLLAADGQYARLVALGAGLDAGSGA